ncbi:MAG: acid phosphatase pho5 [Geoglossum simile]|nr:MAG: acid phosphatase pho5 [Geoglossum simile]
MLNLLMRIKRSKERLKGDLEFANNWEYFAQDPENRLERLTTTGPFAGTLEAFTTGVKLRTRYSHLLGGSGAKKVRFWASDSNRVIDTARYFSTGFFGLDWQRAAELVVIPETADLGADTLTPTDTCTAYLNNFTFGHDYGARMLGKFRSTYLGSVGDRLERQNPQIRFNDSEIYSMQEICGFETTARGTSKWCDVFTHADWLNFEYARDVIHYYRSGLVYPLFLEELSHLTRKSVGTRHGMVVVKRNDQSYCSGSKSRATLFQLVSLFPSTSQISGHEESDVGISVHDSDIVSMVGALNVFLENEDLPIDRVVTTRKWRTSQITPMGGRIILERLTCSKASDDPEELYVRVNVNDGIVKIPHCGTGPGSSCPLKQFVALVSQRGEETGDFRKKCGLSKDSPDRISFLHQ